MYKKKKDYLLFLADKLLEEGRGVNPTVRDAACGKKVNPLKAERPKKNIDRPYF